MKRILMTILLLTSMAPVFAQKPIHMHVGGGLAFGDWANITDDWEESWGMGYQGRLLINNDESRFAITPSYIFFPMNEFSFTESYFNTSTSVTVKPAMHYMNVEASFSAVKSNTLDLYLHLGPSFLLYSETVTASNNYYEGSGTNNEFKTGVIGGAGVRLNLGSRFGVFADAGYSYISDDWDQLLITGGVMVRVF
ncbi:MAG: outer membrane beta-barrel protein [Bacteroidales bacterium]|nr:outer membrane beta-barrel protein [Bacteroidales bacterium]MDD3666476.1 outer membrane beta-barrel protein [Bacteroidales bacterium]